MRFVGKSKIGRLSAKKSKIYAQIRLPPQFANTIGDIANIFETEHNGKRAFLLVTKRSVSNDDMVLQPNEKVVKLEDHKDHDYRLSALESEINELKSIFYSNERFTSHKTENNGLGRIRTGDLRHVKTEDLALSVAFSDSESEDAMTTRKASAPSWIV